MTEAEKDGFHKSTGDIYQQSGKKDLEYHRDDPEYVRLRNGGSYSWERYDSGKHNQDDK